MDENNKNSNIADRYKAFAQKAKTEQLPKISNDYMFDDMFDVDINNLDNKKANINDSNMNNNNRPNNGQNQVNNYRQNQNIQKSSNNDNDNKVSSNIVVNKQEPPKKGKTHNGSMAIIAVCVSIIFFSMVGYMIYFTMFTSKDVINNPLNNRASLLEKTIIRGSIFAADGETIAETIEDDGETIRYYPFGDLFAHVVGRYNKGKTGIESKYDFDLLTTSENEFEIMANEFQDHKSQGNSLKTTLDVSLQKKAYEALGDKKGAVVAIEPSTGKILAMVSTPAYDPNYISARWDEYNNDTTGEHVLLNRATQGRYAPGSTFKIATALEYIKENPNKYSDFIYDCEGTASFNGMNIKCYNGKVHGKLDLFTAFAYSCNTTFATIGTKLDISSYSKLCSQLLFNKDLPYEFSYKKSYFSLSSSDGERLIAQTSMGQGNTLITPLHNAMITAAIANKGVLMKTYVIDEIITHDSNKNKITKPTKYSTLMSSGDADILGKMMENVVKKGTASALNNLSYSVAGKTGSAEFNSAGDSHAWFVGYAPANNPKIVLCVLVEDAGTGGASAVPIAKNLFEEYLK